MNWSYHRNLPCVVLDTAVAVCCDMSDVTVLEFRCTLVGTLSAVDVDVDILEWESPFVAVVRDGRDVIDVIDVVDDKEDEIVVSTDVVVDPSVKTTIGNIVNDKAVSRTRLMRILSGLDIVPQTIGEDRNLRSIARPGCHQQMYKKLVNNYGPG